MVRGARLVFGREGCGVEENHERSSWETWVHVLPALAYGACLACGLDERRNPRQFLGQPAVLAGFNDKRIYASRMAAAFASPCAGHQRNSEHCRGLSQSSRACKSRGF